MNHWIVKQEYADDPRTPGRKVWVSTVHLSMEHGYETMIFPANNRGTRVRSFLDEWVASYGTRQEAEDGHEKVMQLLRNGQWPD